MNLPKFLTFFNRLLFAVALVAVVGISACDDDDDVKPTKTIWQIVQDDSNLSILEEQLLAGGFDDDLEADGSKTLFAPSNAAMNTLLATLGLSNFGTISQSVVQSVLAYHIANNEVLSAGLTNGVEITTLQGEKITVLTTSTGEKTFVTGATSNSKVTSADIRATNGVVHVVDVVLVPPTIGALIVSTIGSVAQPILLGADFTILASGLAKANEFATTAGIPTLTSILSNKDAGSPLLTVFAPTNATFNAGNITAASFSGQQWYGIISHHVVASDVTYGTVASFTQGTQFNTLLTASSGKKLTVIATNAPTNSQITTGIVLDSNGVMDTPEAQIAVLDVLAATGANPAQNGIINVIAGVLSPN